MKELRKDSAAVETYIAAKEGEEEILSLEESRLKSSHDENPERLHIGTWLKKVEKSSVEKEASTSSVLKEPAQSAIDKSKGVTSTPMSGASTASVASLKAYHEVYMKDASRKFLLGLCPEIRTEDVLGNTSFLHCISQCAIDYSLYKQLVDAYKGNKKREGRQSKLNENLKEIDDDLKDIQRILNTASGIEIDTSLGLSVLSVSVATKQKLLGEFAAGCVKLRRKIADPDLLRSLRRRILNGCELTWEMALDALHEQENSGEKGCIEKRFQLCSQT